MPRDVVPIFRSPRRASDSRSRSRWYGRMRCALSLTNEPAVDVDAGARELVDLREQRLRIHDDAVADDAGDAGMQDARRNQPQHELRAVDVDGVPGVVSALVARDDVETRREQVDDLALAFIAPLGAEHSEIHSRMHDSTSTGRRATRRGDAGRGDGSGRRAPRAAMRERSVRVKRKNIFDFRLTSCAALSKFYSFADNAQSLTPRIHADARPYSLARPRSTPRPRASRSCSAAAAPAARRCCSSCASARTHGRAVHRRRAHGDHAGAVPAALASASPFPFSADPPSGARAAFDAALAFFTKARPTGAANPPRSCSTSSSSCGPSRAFPGLRRVLHDFARRSRRRAATGSS